jgi:hypothetical protein
MCSIFYVINHRPVPIIVIIIWVCVCVCPQTHTHYDVSERKFQTSEEIPSFIQEKKKINNTNGAKINLFITSEKPRSRRDLYFGMEKYFKILWVWVQFQSSRKHSSDARIKRQFPLIARVLSVFWNAELPFRNMNVNLYNAVLSSL